MSADSCPRGATRAASRRAGDDDQGLLSLVALLCQDDVWHRTISEYRVQ